MVTQISQPEKISPDTQLLTEEATFQWTKQWYPIAVMEFLDPSRPHPVQLLGKELVLWRDRNNQWRCFEDRCPHRLVPLSEGRVEADGTLLCAYHAWRFDETGKCVSIPQSKDKATENQHLNNPRSCAIAYPTQEQQGLLWVWPESGDQAEQESQTRKPRIIPELEEKSDKVVKLFWYVRDMPFGWDYFMENVCDPAHVPVSHHGMMGSRYKDAKYYDMIREREISTQNGFAFSLEPVAPTIEKAVHDFQPPCLMKISSTFKDGAKFILALYVSPTRPGWCRHIGCQILVKSNEGKTPKGLAFFALPMPTWLGHILASSFLHQDLVFLHYQEKIIARQGTQNWLSSVYTPNPQDKMVITLRKWLENRAGGGIPWAEGTNPELPPPQRDKQQLFDVWSTHTQHCRVCQDALKNINRARLFAYIGAGVCLLFGVILDARMVAMTLGSQSLKEVGSWLMIAPSGAFWGAIVGGIILALGGYYLKKLSRLFYVYEFEHSQND